MTIPTQEKSAIVLQAEDAFSQFLNQIDDWKTKANAINVKDKDDVEAMAEAKKLRLEIRSARTAAEKKKIEMKADALAYGNAVQSCYNAVLSETKPLEQELKEKEDFAIKQEEIRIANLVKERKERLINAQLLEQGTPDLASMDDETFETYFAGAQARSEQAVAKQKAAEEQRAAQLKAEQEERERIAKENELLKAEKLKQEKEAQARLEEAKKAKEAEIAKIRAEEAAKRVKAEAKAKQELEALEHKAAIEAAEREREYESRQEVGRIVAGTNRANNMAALTSILSRHLNGKRVGDLTYVMEKIKRYAEGKDDTSWQYGLDPRVYTQAGLPQDAYMGANQEKESE